MNNNCPGCKEALRMAGNIPDSTYGCTKHGPLAVKKGNCYAASEALYHLLGGKEAGWTPMVIPMSPHNHWILKHCSGIIIDVTVSQFDKPPNYNEARGCGFLTREPSRKARELMEKLVWQEISS